ncbi:MFS transporter [Streptomyces roseoviridis]|uniref:MFS transporter n=1 Tax=Streptomyces roseoviridis TaxID=67361 RepID=A0ABV5QT28_9ACTN
MLSVLRQPAFRRLFTAQVVALLGTGLATVALALLAHDLAGSDATAVLGTALALKMAAYVTVAPLAGALAGRISRRALLVSADLVRACAALALPFVHEVWHVYALIVLLQAASAAFTPVLQATVPDVLPGERPYTEALSLSRLAHDLESLASPALAALLLIVVPYPWLFTGTATGFLASAALVLSAALPGARPPARAGRGEEDSGSGAGAGRGSASGSGAGRRSQSGPGAGRGSECGPVGGSGRGFGDRSGPRPRTRVLTRLRPPGRTGAGAGAAFGVRPFLATPRLRALLALDLAVAAAGAMVLVGTVALVRDTLGRPQGDVPLALGAYGAGSMAVALLLPRVLDRVDDRRVMLAGAFALPVLLGALALGLAAPAGAVPPWPGLLVVWLLTGAATSAVLTPSGRVLRRSAGPADLPAVFAAHFSLAHACWLLTYPLAGLLIARTGPALPAALLGTLALAGALAAARLWPRADPVALPHDHPELPAGHPHLAGVPGATGAAGGHAHPFRIDALHRHWPTTAP